ncbi:MAG: 2-oxoacid:acceptor oxidoreductase subunit alpha [Leptospirales bacterium]|nr:2-oxoacid:acceptor oxidoreductase subunit alpha [Leptospirales bacterium]
MSSGASPVHSQNERQVKHETIESAIVRFAGDSGDGMQITGAQFTTTTGVAGNDLMTFPDFPAEIRAPVGTLGGVSGFQIHFSSRDIHTPGDLIDVLVAMNPAALKVNLKDLRPGGVLLVNTDAFDERNLSRVGYSSNPLEDPAVAEKYQLIRAPITKLTRTALEGLELQQNHMDRCKNFFALGVAYWLYQRDPETTTHWIKDKFKKNETFVEANLRALRAGYNFAEASELFTSRYEVRDAHFEPGLYRNINGATAIALGLIAGADRAGLELLYAGYPITPASDILHELSKHKNFGVKTFQAEDEIAAAGAAIGASYGGSLGVTASAGPGINLKLEAMNLAMITELPLVVINAQRAGPSTGLPTKTEQGDLLQSFFGRNGESPIPILASATPADSFDCSIEAVRLAVEFMTPVMYLSELFLIFGSEPWRVPSADSLPVIRHNQIQAGEDPAAFHTYARDEKTLARRWAIPGIPGFEHRVGGLEKDALSGAVSYDPDNHERMALTRQQKIENIANFIPEQSVYGEESGQLLILGWGGTHGAIRAAVEELKREGVSVSHAHLRYLNPFPRNLGEILKRFDTILIPELNLGQLSWLIRARFLREVVGLHKVKGRPFLVGEIKAKAMELLGRN